MRAISEPVSAPTVSSIEETYKGRDVEGLIDIHFYRRVGYGLAVFFARLGFTPIAVTLLGGVFGLLAGHLYYYPSLALNLIGLVFHVVANLFDNADGQLARLTNQSSRTGRLIDSVVDQMIWVNIYLHLGLRLQHSGWSAAIWPLVAATLASHAVQAAAADYCRNTYLFFVAHKRDMDSSEKIRRDYQELSWPADFGTKFLLTFYLGVTRQQEFLSPAVHRLYRAIEEQAGAAPAWLSGAYQAGLRPLLRWWSLQMTNTRMLLLLLVFLVRQPALFLWIELSVFNLLLLVLLLWQERIGRKLFQRLALPRA